MDTVLRILDANANRAREALRVMEEAARFHFEDIVLTAALKSLRHDLMRAMKSRFDGLEFNRDTAGDVGTTVSTAAERSRASIAEVVIAAGKRLSEALRAIEEYGKTIDPSFASAIEAMRYRAYDVESALARRLGSGRGAEFRVCILLTESRCARPWREVVHEAVEGGADCIQLREKPEAMNDATLLGRALELVEIVDGRAAVIINDRPDIALISGADGVHLGQDDLPARGVRDLVGRRLLIGVSTSTLDEAKRALDDGADYCGAGPMFPSTTKPKERIAGPAYLREFLAWGKLPHLAIGGISPDNVDQLTAVGCRGVAVSSAVCSAADPRAAVQRLLIALQNAEKEPQMNSDRERGIGD